MKSRVYAVTQRLLALLLLCAVLLPCLPVYASSTPSSGTSGVSSTSAEASSADEEPESLLAQPGNGLYNPSYKPQAAGWCLLNTDTGLRVAEGNADTPLVAASLVKMMTAILTMEHMENFNKDLDTTLVDTTNKSWVYDALFGMNASTADIRLGEVLTVRELLYAILLPSANEAAWFLADYVSGGNMTNFMHQMNTRAQSLGCGNTYFDDPNGLSQMNVTTAYDMALIMAAFAKHPVLLEMAQSDVFEMPAHEKHNAPYNIHTTNRLMVKSSPYYAQYPSVSQALLAGKTGSLGEWQNFAAIASKDGQTYVCVMLNSPHEADTVAADIEGAPPRPALIEAAEVLNWAFKELEVRPALDTTQPVTELRVRYSTQQDTVMLIPESDVKAVLPKEAGEEMLKRRYELPESVAAPVAEGAVLGSVTLSIGEQEIGSSDLMAQKSVERNDTLFVMNKTEDAITSTYVKVLIVVAIVFALLYAGVFWLANNSRKRRQQAARNDRATLQNCQNKPPQKRPANHGRKPKG